MNLSTALPSRRRKRRLSLFTGFFAAFLSLVFAACARSHPSNVSSDAGPFDPGALCEQCAFKNIVELLALGPRDAGTPGAEQAARHLKDRLTETGINASIHSFQAFTPTGRLTFHNVIGRLPGRGRGLLLLGSHFDTKADMGPGFQGANDSGSSTGLLLELARVLQAGPTVAPEIWVVFFDGEECQEAYTPHDGLHGSRQLAARLVKTGRAKDVRAVILLDMIGDADLNITLPRNADPTLQAHVLEAAAQENVRSYFGLYPGRITDDHIPFLEAGMPAVNIIDFEFGSRPGWNDYWHTEKDRLDAIRAESLGRVGRVVIRLLNRLTAPEPIDLNRRVPWRAPRGKKKGNP